MAIIQPHRNSTRKLNFRGSSVSARAAGSTRAGRRSVTQLRGCNRKRSTAELSGSHTPLLTHAQPSHPAAASEEASHLTKSKSKAPSFFSYNLCSTQRPGAGAAHLLSHGRLFRSPTMHCGRKAPLSVGFPRRAPWSRPPFKPTD